MTVLTAVWEQIEGRGPWTRREALAAWEPLARKWWCRWRKAHWLERCFGGEIIGFYFLIGGCLVITRKELVWGGKGLEITGHKSLGAGWNWERAGSAGMQYPALQPPAGRCPQLDLVGPTVEQCSREGALTPLLFSFVLDGESKLYTVWAWIPASPRSHTQVFAAGYRLSQASSSWLVRTWTPCVKLKAMETSPIGEWGAANLS